MSKFCQNTRFPTFAVAVGIAVALFSGSARSESFQDLEVTVRGTGQPVLMIPGLNSAATVWDETCAQLQPAGVQCHIVQLPGFAGQSPAKLAESDGFLDTMRDRLLAYITTRKLTRPVVMGHSLGGVVTLKMALKSPASVERLVIVDALPFWPAVRDPNATAQSMKPMAQGMRSGMLGTPVEAYQTQLKANLVGMTRSPERVERLAQWGLASDRATTAQAMYEMFTTDLRGELSQLNQPTLVLGAWAGYAAFGATQASVRKTYEDQYQKLKGVRVELSEGGYHFLMWDDTAWLVAQVRQFMAPAAAQTAAATQPQ